MLEKELEQRLSQPSAETGTVEEPSKVNIEAGKADNEFLEPIQPTSETDEAEPEWNWKYCPQ